jgi:Xaa-Pro aminopeptidase
MTEDFFNDNRKRLAENIKNGVIVVSAYAQMQQTNDAAFAFVQEANFWYLTGIEQPDWWVIIDGNKSWLVSPDVSTIHQIFDGSLSPETAKEISGVDAVINQEEAKSLLVKLAKDHHTVYTIGESPHAEHFDFTLNPAPKKIWDILKKVFDEVQDCRLELARLRAIKQPTEINAMKKAIQLTTNAFDFIKPKLSQLSHEYEVEAEFGYYFRRNGAVHAYDPIVASGHHACTLHYNENDSKLEENQLVLIDIGARINGYSADVTRTYSVGQPTERQIEVHAAVAQAHQQIISLLAPGVLVKTYHDQVDEIMKKALLNLGLLDSSDDYRRYFPHAISHGLGVDVHDSLGQPTEFLPGMVLTVEPGIYITEEQIGVRIEDDILITETSHLNLSGSLSTDL